jgi:hypothetical protein
MLESALISSGGIWAVTIDFKWMTTLVAATSIAVLPVTLGVSAVTVEVAKKCDALVAKKFPPREPGNPAAGNAGGPAEPQRKYFKRCLANQGNLGSDRGQER